MPNNGAQAFINNIGLPVYNIKTSVKRTTQRIHDYSALLTQRYSNFGLQLSFVIEDDDDFTTLGELASNTTWNCLSFAPKPDADTELAGYYCLQNANQSQGGETWQTHDWTFGAKQSFFQWLVDGASVTTDWDTMDSITDGTYTSLRNDEITGLVADGVTYISIPDGAALDWGEWWDSSIILSADIYAVAAMDIRLCFRKCTTSASRNGCYYIEFDIGDYVRFHYIDTAGTDEVLFNYSYTSVIETYYSLVVVAEGQKFTVYVGTQGAEEYAFTVYDDRLTSGKEEIYGTGAACRVQNLSVAIQKPLYAQLIPGSIPYNEMPMQPNGRLGDNTNSRGYGNTVIAPQNRLLFKPSQSVYHSDGCEGLWIPTGDYNTIFDQSGHNRHLSYTSGTAYWSAEHPYYGAYSVATMRDSINYYQWSTTTADIGINHGYTVHLLIKPEEHSVDAASYFLRCYGNAREIITFYVASDNHLNITMTDSAGAAQSWDTAITITFDEWQLITLTWDGLQDHNLYIDGALEATRDDGENLYWDTIDQIDAYGWDDSSEMLQHQLAMVQLLSYEQSAADILTYYQSLPQIHVDGAAVKIWDTCGENGHWDYLECHLDFNEGWGDQVYDSSKNNRSVTAASWATTDWSASSYCPAAKYCYHFDGAADTFYSALGTEDVNAHGWTIGGWFNFDTVGASDPLFVFRDTTANVDTLYLSMTSATNMRLLIDSVAGNDGQYDYILSPTTGRWYFIVITWDGTVGTAPLFYINGVAVTVTATQVLTGAVYDADRLYIGYSTALAHYYDGYIDDVFVYSIQLSATEIAWLYQHMPTMVNESLWQPVYAADHVFVGDMIIDNGHYRLTQTFRQINGSTSYHTKLTPYLFPYAEGQWWWNYRQFPLVYSAGSSSYLITHQPWELIQLEKYHVQLKGRCNASGGEWVTYQYDITQHPLISITFPQWYLTGNLNVYSATARTMLNAACGVQLGVRFGCTTADSMIDSFINTTGSGSKEEGLIVGMNHIIPAIWIFANTDDDGTWQSLNAAAAYDPLDALDTTTAIDFDADSPPHRWWLGFMPNSQATIHGEIANWTDYDDSGGAGAGWNNIYISAARPFAYCTLNIPPTTMYSSITLSAGTYQVWALLAGGTGDEDGTLSTTLATYYNGSATLTNVPAAGQWYHVDCITSDANSIRVNIQMTAGTSNIKVGEVVIVPVSNSKNFPLDLWHQALAQSRITEGLTS